MLASAILNSYQNAVAGILIKRGGVEIIEGGNFALGDAGEGMQNITYWDESALGPKPIESDVLAAFDSLIYWRVGKIAEVYSRAKQLLDAQSTGRSAVELSRWPLMQSEVIKYQSDGIIGPTMQAEISLGRHTADSLVALIAPKIAYEQSVMQSRTNHVLAIEASADPETYDTATGWPE